MRYFEPDIELPAEAERNSILGRLFGAKCVPAHPPASRERLGGAPVGLAESAWPACRDCGKSQSLIAQFAHHPDRLDLGREGRMLFVFQCNHDPGMCETWDKASGANACLVIEPEAIGDEPTPVPADSPPLDDMVLITGWQEGDDDVRAADAAKFFRDSSYGELDEAVFENAGATTRLGGVPYWVQSPDESPNPGWRYLGQLVGEYHFLRRDSREADRVAALRGHNFGDGGLAYLFARDHGGDPPEIVMFWQCG